MTTRYYKVTDPAMLQAVKENVEKRLHAREVADAWAKAHGFTESVFYLDGLYGESLVGMKCSRSEHWKREDKDSWTIPKEGITRPKSKKKSKVCERYLNLCRETRVDGENLEEMFGFNHLTYFPTRPGYQYSKKGNFMVFKMPARCEDVNGCVEITNLEYIELKKLGESDETE